MRQPRYADNLALFELMLASFLMQPDVRENLPMGIVRRLRMVKTARL